MKIFFIAFFIILLGMLGMAIGVIAKKNKGTGELKGSCGGSKTNPDCCMKKNEDCSKDKCH